MDGWVVYLQSVSLLDSEDLLNVRFLKFRTVYSIVFFFFFCIPITSLPFATVTFAFDYFVGAASLSASAGVLLVLCALSESSPVKVSIFVSRCFT